MSDQVAGIPRQSGRFAPTLPQLRAFFAVCEMRHFGRAAAWLGVGQSTLSEALAALEANVGQRLVERTTRQVVITPAGRRLLPHARAAVAAADAFAEAAEQLGGLLAGSLRLGLIPTVAPYLLPVLLGGLADTLPALELSVREEQTAELLAALRAGELDAAVLALPVGEADLRELPLYDEDFLVLLPVDHAWAKERELEPEALADGDLLLLEPGHCLRDQTLALCGEQAAREAARANAISLPTIVQLVAGGMGVTVAPATAVRVEGRRARVATVPLAGDPPPGRCVGLAYRASSGREEDYAELAALIRAAVRRARLPVRVAA